MQLLGARVWNSKLSARSLRELSGLQCWVRFQRAISSASGFSCRASIKTWLGHGLGFCAAAVAADGFFCSFDCFPCHASPITGSSDACT
jgi:hypothetical protein